MSEIKGKQGSERRFFVPGCGKGKILGHLKSEIAVVGGGLAGYATAVGFALGGFDTVLLAPTPSKEDRRSTALIGPSVSFLESLGVFAILRPVAEPLAVM